MVRAMKIVMVDYLFRLEIKSQVGLVNGWATIRKTAAVIELEISAGIPG